jgi:plastocyanin
LHIDRRTGKILRVYFCKKNGVAVLLVLAGVAHARLVTGGTIRGTVTATTAGPSGVVVWVEGPPGTPPARNAVLTQRKMLFEPALLVVVAGQRVEMPNEDSLAHNVSSRSPARPFDLGIYEQGEVKAVNFPEAGVVDVRCEIHPRMRATILVVPTSFYAQTASGVPFEIKDVPPGKVKVVAWQVGMVEGVPREVTVPAKGDLTVDFTLLTARAQ